ncbi:N-acetyltransferase [Streptomyces sp. NPDC127072]|uniref:N-acetyltransferase n=1 Tax=Streptomyces sp. NPDC127072 TaxID=3347129 RepID=UPI0036551FA8
MPDPGTYLPVLLSRPGSVHLAAWDDAGRIVALGHLMPDRSAVEAALLVEDTWQDRGLGTRLLRRMGGHAARGGWKTVYGLILPGDQRIDAVLRHATAPVHRRDDGGVIRAWTRTRDLEASPALRPRCPLWRTAGRRRGR